MARILRCLGTALVLPSLLLAHDTWLIPAGFRPAPGEPVRVRLATSEAFPTSESAVRPERIERFTLRTAAGTMPVAGYGVEGTDLVAELSAPTAGHAVAVAETKPRLLEMKPEDFNSYLRDEELQEVLAARASKGQTGAPGRERYRKIAKTILCPSEARKPERGGTLPAVYAQPDGLWLEIVPEQDPCDLRVGDTLAVRVLFEDKPLRGAHLAAGYAGVAGHKYPVWLATDSAGRARVRLDRAGAWFVRVLHMIPAAHDPEADWHSAFSTLTFEVLPAR